MEKVVLLYYKFVAVPNPTTEVQNHKEICQKIGLLGRILIGQEGINGTVEGSSAQVKAYQDYLNTHPFFNGIVFKETLSAKSAFRKLKIKEREEIVTINRKVDLKKSGQRLSPEDLHQLLESNEDVVLIDMRNKYESEIGRFRNAVAVDTQNFRDLPEKIAALKKYKDKKVVTYCTGGIRCEKASALLVEEGFTDVYQLEGGIFKYAEKYPDGYFDGSCFVFDERLSVDFNPNPAVLTACEFCQKPTAQYTDCANNSCHRLFICCSSCQEKYQNFCPQVHENESLTV